MGIISQKKNLNCYKYNVDIYIDGVYHIEYMVNLVPRLCKLIGTLTFKLIIIVFANLRLTPCSIYGVMCFFGMAHIEKGIYMETMYQIKTKL